MDSAGLGIDARSLDSLRRQANDDPRAATKQAAEQFEALFMRQMLKTMRASIPKSGLTDSAGEKMAQEMLDDHLTANMVGQPGGLSEVIARHMSRYMPDAETPAVADAEAVASAGIRGRSAIATKSVGAIAALTEQTDESGSPVVGGSAVSFSGLPVQLLSSLQSARPDAPDTQQERFVSRLWSHAEAAEKATGVPAAFVLGQAALESGWGKGEMNYPDGRPAYNLFGIKAGSNWDGPTVQVRTKEYVDGKKVSSVESFRAYESYEESFNDWVGLMKGHPRYQNVLREAASPAAFAQGLQAAGYATDPRYAEKLNQVIEKTIELQQDLV